MVKRAYKYRFYPTPEQADALARTFGCVRYIYNWGLDLRKKAYRENGQSLSCSELSRRLTGLKGELPWLCEPSSVPLQQALRHLDTAYQNFFQGRCGYPDFKSRRRRQSATFVRSAFTFRHGVLFLAKIGELEDVRWSRTFFGDPSSVTVSRDSSGRYFVSILVEEEVHPKSPASGQVGIDLGITDFAALSTGEKVPNPKCLDRDLLLLARAQRDLSRKEKGSRNREKARLRVSRIHTRISDRRQDFLHKLTSRLIDENQVICVEDLAVKNLSRNRSLSRAIGDAGWGEFVRQLEYKASWYGRTFVRVGRFFPSSKVCSGCGHRLEALSLKIRSWVCPGCGEAHDRDVNAAKNILAEGRSVSACGEAVRPDPAKPGRARFREAGSLVG